VVEDEKGDGGTEAREFDAPLLELDTPFDRDCIMRIS